MSEILKLNDGRPVHFKTFRVNTNLLFSLKTISGDSESEIISYFYDIGLTLLKDAINRGNSKCQRVVKINYKEHLIQVRFEVTGFFMSHINNVEVNMYLNNCGECVSIGGEAIIASIVERDLGLAESNPIVVEAPPKKLFKCLK